MRTVLLAFAVCSILATPTMAGGVYKITDPDGKVRFTDTPPEHPGNSQVETVTLPPENQNVMMPDPQMQQWVDQKQAADSQAAQQKQSTLAEWQKEYDAAKARLAAAEKALANGKDPQEGDFVGMTNRFGGSAGARPSDEYLQRVDTLEADAKAAREALDAVLQRKPTVSGSP